MNFFEKLNTSQKFLQAMVFKKKFPLVVGWNITYKCNLRCGYCGACYNVGKELDTKSIFKIIKELATLGTRIIKFTGGEPFLREDLKDIIDFCRAMKISVLINSNGTLVKKEQEKLKGIKEIQLSLDGPPQIHDAIRGKGVHDKVIEAVKICKDRNISVMLTTVISKYNISHIPYILDIAKEYKIGVYFQPVDQNLSSNSPKDIKLLFAPENSDYKKIIRYLIEEKKKNNKFISNSLAGLKHLYHWPVPRPVKCLMNLICCVIEPDGKMFVCDMFPNYRKYLVPMGKTFKDSFDKLSLPFPCQQCWNCLAAEFNLLASFKLEALGGLWRKARNIL